MEDEASLYVAFSNLVSHRSSQARTFSPQPYSPIVSAYVPPSV